MGERTGVPDQQLQQAEGRPMGDDVRDTERARVDDLDESIEKVRVLRLEPGDRLAVHLADDAEFLTHEFAEVLSRRVAEWAGVAKGRVLLFVGDAELSVLRQEDS